MTDQILNVARASRAIPQAVADTLESTMRATSFGDQFMQPLGSPRHALADEGSYFVATNPTPGTAVASSTSIATTFSDTAALFVVANQAPAGSNVTLCLDYLRAIVQGTVPATATGTHFAAKVDTASRTPTSQATKIAPVNVNLASTRTAYGALWCPATGTPVVPASGAAARLIARGCIRSVISVFNDVYEWRCGAQDGAPAVAAAGAGTFKADLPPVILGPGQFFVLHVWSPGAATNPLSLEFEAGWWER